MSLNDRNVNERGDVVQIVLLQARVSWTNCVRKDGVCMYCSCMTIVGYRSGSKGGWTLSGVKAQVFFTNIILHRRVFYFTDITVMFISRDSLY